MLTAVILMTICSSAEMTGVRLVDGDDHCSGTPEVLHDGEWRRVFSDFFHFRAAKLFCRDLGCGDAVSVRFQRDFRGLNERNPAIIYLLCSGQESNVSQCPALLDAIDSSWLNYSTVLLCSDSVRLVDGAGLCSGRVEVKSSQSWTTVHGVDFDREDAQVVCKELGCGTPLNLHAFAFDQESPPFGTKEFHCTGTEHHLLNCSTSFRYGKNGEPGNALGLNCSEPNDVRLVDGRSRCAGTVQMFYSGEWRRVGSDGWSIRHAAVVCRQLGCGSAVAAKKSMSGGDGAEWGLVIGCEGSESALRECSIMNNFQVKFLGTVMCSGLLVQPTISVSTPDSHFKGPEVFRGHSFTITCSTKPQYPGGSFYLKLPGTRSNSQTAVNHSSSFHFPAADPSQQGSYHCVYENHNVYQLEASHPESFNPTFSSESEPLSLLVTDSPLPGAITRLLLVPFLLGVICLFVFMTCKKWGHLITRNASGHKGAAADHLQSAEMSSIRSSADVK